MRIAFDITGQMFRAEEGHSPSKVGRWSQLQRKPFVLARKWLRVQDRGLEPLGDFDASVDCHSSSSDCKGCCAARALHPGGLDCQFLSSVDPELQRVMAAWGGLPTAIRKAIVTLLECQK